MRTFLFTWYKNVKYGEPQERKTYVKVSNRGDLSLCAKNATDVFCSVNGNLKKNTVLSIQEMKDGEPIGEPIVPMADTSIVPTKK